MNIFTILQALNTQEQAIDYLEEKRWYGHPVCSDPSCKSLTVNRHASSDGVILVGNTKHAPVFLLSRWEQFSMERTSLFKTGFSCLAEC